MTSWSWLAALPVAAIAAFALAGCGGDKATLDTFAGTWQAHGRTLTITPTGNGQEVGFLGPRPLRYRSSVQRFAAEWVASRCDGDRDGDGRSTRGNERLHRAGPAPRVGESRRIRVRDGVITGLTGENYCGPEAEDSIGAGCGA